MSTERYSINDDTYMTKRYEYNSYNDVFTLADDSYEDSSRRPRSIINLPLQTMTSKGNISSSDGLSCCYYISNICIMDEVSAW